MIISGGRPHLFVALTITISLLVACASQPPDSDIVILDQSTGLKIQAPINNFHVVGRNIFRGGQPEGEDQWAFLQRLGIKAVIKLNRRVGRVDTVQTERDFSKKYGIKVIELFLPPEDFPNLNFLGEPKFEDIRSAMSVLGMEAESPIFVHCSHGSDRTGLIIAVYRVENQNFCKQKAYSEMLKHGHNTLLLGIKKALFNDQIKERRECEN